MARVSYLLLVLLALASTSHTAAFAGGDDEKIVGVWERETGKGKDLMEETWVVKKTKDKWTVSGTIYNRGEEVGNFKGKDVKFKDGELSFTQDFFKLPKGFATGSKITMEAEGDRLDVAATKGKEETKYNMERAGDASELLGTWKGSNYGYNEVWTIEKDKKGNLSLRGTVEKGGKQVGLWKGVNVRYFMHTLWYNQQFDQLPATWTNGTANAGTVREGQFHYVWDNGRGKGKNKMTLDAK